MLLLLVQIWWFSELMMCLPSVFERTTYSKKFHLRWHGRCSCGFHGGTYVICGRDSTNLRSSPALDFLLSVVFFSFHGYTFVD